MIHIYPKNINNDGYLKILHYFNCNFVKYGLAQGNRKFWINSSKMFFFIRFIFENKKVNYMPLSAWRQRISISKNNVTRGRPFASIHFWNRKLKIRMAFFNTSMGIIDHPLVSLLKLNSKILNPCSQGVEWWKLPRPKL